MNFNVYVDKRTGERLRRLAKARRTTRNALIREALAHLLDREANTSWPEAVLDFEGDRAAPRFEATRERLAPPREDPFE